jgi:hypothetical protein
VIVGKNSTLSKFDYLVRLSAGGKIVLCDAWSYSQALQVGMAALASGFEGREQMKEQ